MADAIAYIRMASRKLPIRMPVYMAAARSSSIAMLKKSSMRWVEKTLDTNISDVEHNPMKAHGSRALTYIPHPCQRSPKQKVNIGSAKNHASTQAAIAVIPTFL